MRISNQPNAQALPKQASSVKSAQKQAPFLPGDVYQAVPRHVQNEDGKPGDPVNLIIEGNRAQIQETFKRAGWIEADPLNLWSSIKMVFCTLFGRPYDSAPVSSLYLGSDKHPQDLAFERPTTTTKERDHVRLWDTGKQDATGQEVWIASATKDVGIEMNKRDFGPTHRISPNVDHERDLVVQTLTRAGAQEAGVWDRGLLTGINGEGDRYWTDGQVDRLKILS